MHRWVSATTAQSKTRATLWPSSARFGLRPLATAAAPHPPPPPSQHHAAAAQEEEEGKSEAAGVMSSSFFDAAPLLEMESLSLTTAMTGATAAAQGPAMPPPPPSQRETFSPSIPSRLLSSLPSYLLPGFLMGGGSGSNSRKTFKPLKQHTSNKRLSLHRYSQATLATGITRAAVACPPSEDPDEWLAVHTVDAYNEVSLLFGVISDRCLPDSPACQVMNAGPGYQYLWADAKAYKTPTKVSAKEYVALLLSWVEEQLNDESVFPGSTGVPFPKGKFKPTVSKVFTRLFRVYAHLYLTHLPHVEARGALQHLNSCFRHFLFCALEFSLINERELAPLQPLIRGILAEDARRTHAAALESSPASSSSPSLRRPPYHHHHHHNHRPAPSPSAQARLIRSQSSGGGSGGGGGSSSGGAWLARAFSSSSAASSPLSSSIVPSSEEGSAIDSGGGSSGVRRAQSQQLSKRPGAGSRPSRSYSDLERRVRPSSSTGREGEGGK